VIDKYFEQIVASEESQGSLKRALFTIEDNLRPGNPEYEVDRVKMSEIIEKNRAFIDKEKVDELKQIQNLMRVEEEIRKQIN